MSYVQCPYCDHDCGDYFDDMHDPDVDYEWECEGCGKIFIFVISYTPSFSERKADCLNGGKHDYEPICGAPREFFKDKYKCTDCGKEKHDPEHRNHEVGK